MRAHWTIDPDVLFLNHGSFGACPKPVLDFQSELRARLEREPVQFFVNSLEALLDGAREHVAPFVGAAPEDFGFVRNATTGVNCVLRSIAFEPDDELLTTDHVYNACGNTLNYVASRTGAKVVVAKLPFPIHDADEVVTTIVEATTPRTRLALIDHVTSPTGLVLPIRTIVARLNDIGIDTLVDGAHAPGMLDLNVNDIGAAYYAANFHKWVCAPKGAGMLWVRTDRQRDIHPVVISHGYNSGRIRKRFLEEMDWTGTDDPTPVLSVPEAIRFIGSLLPGGWPAVRDHNRHLALTGRAILCDAIGLELPAPESMIGSLAAVPIPIAQAPDVQAPLYADALRDVLFRDHLIEVPVFPWPAAPARLLRISAHLYNHEDEYRTLAKALCAELEKGN